ncbi:Box C/D snoRNA protein 1 [Halotydeus destructor]|nr:Box C/D snoRNA protein 1 [Halotydeus destructor]
MAETQYFGLFGNVEDVNKPVTSNKPTLDTLDVAVKNRDEVILNKHICSMCDSRTLKYKCPKCSFRTCSLVCVKKHKAAYGCDGKRDRIPFSKISEFTEDQFHDDFTFLEDANNAIESAARARKNIVQSLFKLPTWLEKLRLEARIRGTRLKILPAGFSKRRSNRSTYMYKEKAIYWDIEWIFAAHNKDESDFIFQEHRVCENLPIKDCLARHVSPTDVFVEFDKTTRLSKYRNSDEVTVLLKTERCLFRADMDKGMKDNLIGKTLVEFPTFIVILKECENHYTIVENDAKKPIEADEQTKDHESSDHASDGSRKEQSDL